MVLCLLFSCWIIFLRGNPPSWLYMFSVAEPQASEVVWAVVPPSWGTDGPVLLQFQRGAGSM